ncbi:MAG: elongation factor G [Kiritimatiellia bacterium]
MKEIPVSQIRNFAILGHSGCGKTTLTDALIYKLGLNDRQGSVDNGSSVSDYTDEEKARKISLFACPFVADYKSDSGNTTRFVFTDTPGYMDFYGQVLGAVRGSDAALIVVDASGGVQVGTRRAWQACEADGLVSRAFVITGLDKENTNFDKTLEAIRHAFGNGCVPVVVPVNGKMVDLLAANDLSEELQEMKGQLVEAAAETDDTMIEKYLAGEKLSADEIGKGLVQAVAAGKCYPVFAVMPLKEAAGLKELLEGFHRLLPCPGSRVFKDTAGHVIKPDHAAPFIGQVCRTVIDTFVGQLSFVRVITGTLTKGELYNVTANSKESAGALIHTIGKKQVSAESAGPGEIVAIPKLKVTRTSHTLAAPGQTVQITPLVFPNPVMYMALTAKTQADEDKMGTAIHRLCDQDPTLLVEKNAETKEVVLKGLGDVHIDVATKLMKAQSNVNVDLSTPKVPYRETVTALGDGHYKHKKQTGGRGQYGEVYLRVDPKRAGEEEWFLDEIVGGTIPNNFKPAVQKGAVEGMLAGSVAGYPVQNVKVHMYDGSFHDVDSSEIAFKIAALRAFRDAMSKARPVLLEPIMTVKVSIPEQFMGTINGDLTHRRGRVMGLEVESGMQTITAEAPLSEMFKYAAELRSMTGGQGTFDMFFNRYEVVPAAVAQKIIAEAAKHRKVEEED